MNLNDDCLMLIFSLLDVSDQISTAQAYPRFHDLLSPLWQRKHRVCRIQCWKITHRKLAFFMKSVKSTVQKIVFKDLTYKEWNIIRSYTYPNLTELNLNDSENVDDELILEMTKLFPKLRSLSLCCAGISGSHLEKWRHLENLDFEGCRNIKFNNFEKILEKLQLRSVVLGKFLYDTKWKSTRAFKSFCGLEEISLRHDQLEFIIDLSLYTHLKKLKLLTSGSHYLFETIRQIIEHKCDNLVELSIGNDFPLKTLFGRTFNNLRKVYYYFGDSKNIIEISKFAPSLREIIIGHCNIRQKDDIDRLLNSTQMDVIALEHCRCEFYNFTLNVKNIVKHRANTLHFNFYNNTSSVREYVLLDVQGESSLLTITCDRLNQYYLASTSFRFR